MSREESLNNLNIKIQRFWKLYIIIYLWAVPWSCTLWFQYFPWIWASIVCRRSSGQAGKLCTPHHLLPDHWPMSQSNNAAPVKIIRRKKILNQTKHRFFFFDRHVNMSPHREIWNIVHLRFFINSRLDVVSNSPALIWVNKAFSGVPVASNGNLQKKKKSDPPFIAEKIGDARSSVIWVTLMIECYVRESTVESLPLTCGPHRTRPQGRAGYGMPCVVQRRGHRGAATRSWGAAYPCWQCAWGPKRKIEIFAMMIW